LGFNQQERVGESAYDLVHPDDIAYLKTEFQAGLLQHGQLRIVRFRLLTKAGHYLQVEATASFFVSLFGPIHAGAVLSIREIGQNIRIEEEASVRLHALEASANAIAITTTDGLIEWVNPAFTTLTGYGLAEAIGQHTRILRSPRQSQAFYQQLWQTILSGNTWHGELQNKRKDGTLYEEEMTINPIMTKGTITHFVAIKQDITQRNKQKFLLEQHTKELENMNKLMIGRELRMQELKKELEQLRGLVKKAST
jgi:PAS domain S-box-containing protein